MKPPIAPAPTMQTFFRASTKPRDREACPAGRYRGSPRTPRLLDCPRTHDWQAGRGDHPAEPGRRGCLFVIAAPSGGGKTSLVNALLAREPGIRLSVRTRRASLAPEKHDGVHYHFVDETRFNELKAAGEFLEHAYVHGHWYATSATWLAAQVAARPGRAAGNRLAGRRSRSGG